MLALQGLWLQDLHSWESLDHTESQLADLAGNARPDCRESDRPLRFAAPCIMAAVASLLTVARFDSQSDCEEFEALKRPLAQWTAAASKAKQQRTA